MKYKIALFQTDDGFSVSVPGLPGCWSQGATEAEALANIRDAISEYLAVRDELLRDAQVREVEVVWPVAKLPGVNHLSCHPAAQSRQRIHDGRHRARRRVDCRGVSPTDMTPLQGRPVANVRLPFQVSGARPLVITKDRVFTFTTDEDGVAYLVALRIEGQQD
jgi:predicted RNase H-like HicB family nuclease